MKIIFPYNLVRPATPAILGATARPEDKWFFLTSFKDLVTTYKVIKEVPNKYKEIEFDEKEFFAVVGSQMNIPMWDLILDLAQDIENSSFETPKLQIKDFFIEADNTILEDVIPNGIRLADGQLTFSEFITAGEESVPFTRSLDGTKVVIKASIGGYDLTHTELLAWNAFKGVSDKNIKFLTYFEMSALTSSSIYSDFI